MEKATKNQLRLIKDLLREKTVRDANNMFVVEGEKIIRDVLYADGKVVEAFVSNDFEKENSVFVSLFQERGIPVYSVNNADFEKVSSLKNSQGVISVMKKTGNGYMTAMDKDHKIIVLCDEVQDPGNLGTMIRSALAFGVSAFICTDDTADPYNPKVIRASIGGVKDISFYKYSDKLIDDLKKRGYTVLAGLAKETGTVDIRSMEKNGTGLILIFGNEGKGVSSGVLEKADKYFHISVSDKIESLNVAVSCAVTLYELSRGK